MYLDEEQVGRSIVEVDRVDRDLFVLGTDFSVFLVKGRTSFPHSLVGVTGVCGHRYAESGRCHICCMKEYTGILNRSRFPSATRQFFEILLTRPGLDAMESLFLEID